MLRFIPLVRHSVLLLVVLLTAIVALRPALGQPALRQVDVASIRASDNVSLLLDYVAQDKARYSIEDMLEDQRNPHIEWHQNQAATPGFGFDKHPFWFRLLVGNSSNQALERLLEIKYPVLDEVVFYQVDSEGVIVNQALTGNRSPASQRPFFHHNLVLPFDVPAAQTHYLYFRVTTSGALEFPMVMWTPKEFQERDQLYLLIFGALFGILVVMSVYNFFIYILFRDVSLLFYAGYALGLMLFLASVHGFSSQHFWPSSQWWRMHVLLLIIPVTLYCGIMFSVSFLQLRNAYPLMTILVRGGGLACLLMLVLVPFLSYSVLIRIMAAVVFPICALGILLGLHRWRHGYQPARYFILAWGVFLLAISYYSLAKFGVFETSPGSEYAVQWGAVLQMVLLAFALADRLNSQRQSFAKAQAKALELQRAVNEELESRVDERTQKLRLAMDELEAANQRLQALTMQDGLTGIYNRRYFDEKLAREWHRALRSNESLALLLIDIDFFKDFNDKHGHLAGDECLKQVAQVIQSLITRPSDAVARYGGEEFVVVLPDTKADGAMHVAENIRREMLNLNVRVDDALVCLSVSIGVVSRVPDEQGQPQDLIGMADQALYQAKSAGRNRTVLAGIAN